jgi:hypothetical protein
VSAPPFRAVGLALTPTQWLAAALIGTLSFVGAILIITIIRYRTRLKHEEALTEAHERARLEREAKAPKWGVAIPIRVYEKLLEDLNLLSRELSTYKDDYASQLSKTIQDLRGKLSSYATVVNKSKNPLVPARELQTLYNRLVELKTELDTKWGTRVTKELDSTFNKINRRLIEYMDKPEEEEYKSDKSSK